MILAEDVLLLLTDDNGKGIRSGRHLSLVLTGALVVDLAAHERVDIAREHDAAKTGHLVVRDPRPVGEPMLDEALALLSVNGPRDPAIALHALRKGLPGNLYARLAGHGILRREDARSFGFFTTERWPPVDPRHKTQLLARLHDVLVAGATPDARERALVALLDSTFAVGQVVGHADPSEAHGWGRNLDQQATALLARRPSDAGPPLTVDAVTDALATTIKALSAASTP